jgi:hypothetical protein
MKQVEVPRSKVEEMQKLLNGRWLALEYAEEATCTGSACRDTAGRLWFMAELVEDGTFIWVTFSDKDDHGWGFEVGSPA